MFADSTTNTALCRWSLLFVFLSSSVQIPFDGCPEIHMHRLSHLRMKPQPLENNQTHCQLSHKKERRKKKEEKKYTTQRLTYDLSAKLHQMTEYNSSWFGNLLVSSVFFQQMTPASHEEMTVQPEEIITRKNFTDPNCMFCFLCQHAITYKQHRTCTMCL